MNILFQQLLIIFIYNYILSIFVGGTPLGMYKYLIEYYKAGYISFKYVKTFNMDEYVGKWQMHKHV